MCKDKHILALHLEMINSSTSIRDDSGWKTVEFDTVPFIKEVQKGVVAKGDFDNGTFTEIHLVDKFDAENVKSVLSKVSELIKEIKEIDPKARLVSTVGIESKTWRLFDKNPPKELNEFKEKLSKDNNVVFPKTGGDLFVMVKSTRMDLCYEFTKRFVGKLNDNVKEYKEILGFRYMPVPMAAKDLSGFLDGTRNPDHLLRAIADEVVIFPDDNDDEDESHAGGTYMYTGKFVHNLKKFDSFKTDEKNQIIGRDYHQSKPHKGYDNRPENPTLEKPSPSSHIQRGYGNMYRHAMPFRGETEEGLYFVAVSRSLDDLDTALNRMSGHFDKEGSLDNLFKFTKAVTSNYYYVPSMLELKNLEKVKIINQPEDIKSKPKSQGKTIINIEFCTNCGYKTLFLEQKKLLESISEDIRVVGNPTFPRLSAYEVQVQDGPLLWSKLSQKDGRNNYPHVFPTNEVLVEGIQKHLKLENLNVKFNKPKVYETHGTRTGIW
jgi:porphyrinogen peroxidase